MKIFQQKALPGVSPIHKIVVSNRRLGRTNYIYTNDWDMSELDKKVFNYLSERLRPSADVSEARNPKDTTAMQFDDGSTPSYVELSQCAIYITVRPFPQRNLNDPLASTKEPSLWIQGSAKDLGSHVVSLVAQAPGDRPCNPACTSAEEAFGAIKGRLDVVVARVRN